MAHPTLIEPTSKVSENQPQGELHETVTLDKPNITGMVLAANTLKNSHLGLAKRVSKDKPESVEYMTGAAKGHLGELERAMQKYMLGIDKITPTNNRLTHINRYIEEPIEVKKTDIKIAFDKLKSVESSLDKIEEEYADKTTKPDVFKVAVKKLGNLIDHMENSSLTQGVSQERS